jgi:hypothetical protein
VVDLGVRAHYLSRLFPGFKMLRYIYRSLLPCIPAAGVVLLIRLAENGERTLGMAIGELFVYLAATVAAAWVFERPLISEMLSYVRGRDPRLATA